MYWHRPCSALCARRASECSLSMPHGLNATMDPTPGICLPHQQHLMPSFGVHADFFCIFGCMCAPMLTNRSGSYARYDPRDLATAACNRSPLMTTRAHQKKNKPSSEIRARMAHEPTTKTNVGPQVASIALACTAPPRSHHCLPMSNIPRLPQHIHHHITMISL